MSIDAEDGTKFECVSTVHVSKDGSRFTVTLDERLNVSAYRLLSGKYKVGIATSHGKERITAAKLDDAIQFINACAMDYMACECVTERVIVYNYLIDLDYWRMPDGTLCPNGADRKGGGWRSRQSSRSAKFYSLGFSAAVYDKTSYKRASGVTHKWSRVCASDKDAIAVALNSFVNLDINPDDQHEEMPYTEAAARFFHGVMLAMCQLGESVRCFFEDKDKLQIAIDKGQKLLGGGA